LAKPYVLSCNQTFVHVYADLLHLPEKLEDDYFIYLPGTGFLTKCNSSAQVRKQCRSCGPHRRFMDTAVLAGLTHMGNFSIDLLGEWLYMRTTMHFCCAARDRPRFSMRYCCVNYRTHEALSLAILPEGKRQLHLL
jgi:hypothetical protein